MKQSKEARQAERFRDRQRADTREKCEQKNAPPQDFDFDAEVARAVAVVGSIAADMAQVSEQFTANIKRFADDWSTKLQMQAVGYDPAIIQARLVRYDPSKIDHPAAVALRRLRELLEEGCAPSAALWQAGSDPWQGVMNEAAMEPMLQLLSGEARREGDEYTDWRKYASCRSAEECLVLIDRALEASKTVVWGLGHEWQMKKQLGLAGLGHSLTMSGDPGEHVSISSIASMEGEARVKAKRRRERAREQQRRELTRDLETHSSLAGYMNRFMNELRVIERDGVLYLGHDKEVQS